MGPGVKRIEVKSGRIRGVLFLPDGEIKAPGVVEMYGALGVLVIKRSGEDSLGSLFGCFMNLSKNFDPKKNINVFAIARRLQKKLNNFPKSNTLETTTAL